MEICLEFTVEFESPDLKIRLILAVLKHSGKVPSDNESLKNIETVGEIIGAKIYIWILKYSWGQWICSSVYELD